MSNKTKKLLIRIGAAFLVILVAVTTCVILGRATNGFEHDASVIFQNGNNLVHELDCYTSKSGEDENGITWTVLSNRKVRAEGENSSTSSKSAFIIGEIVIGETDYYTLSGVKDDSNEYYIEAAYSVNGQDKVLSTSSDEVVTSDAKIEKGTVVTITLYVAIGAEVDVTFTPTFVAGKDAGRF